MVHYMCVCPPVEVVGTGGTRMWYIVCVCPPIKGLHGGLEAAHLVEVVGTGELLVDRELGLKGVVVLLQREGGEVALRIAVPVDPDVTKRVIYRYSYIPPT